MAKSIYARHLQVDDDGDDVWVMRKFDLDLEPLGTYEIREDYSGQFICTCPARAQLCRHVKMMEMFTNAEAGVDEVYTLTKIENPGKMIMLQTDNKKFEWVPTFEEVASDG